MNIFIPSVVSSGGDPATHGFAGHKRQRETTGGNGREREATRGNGRQHRQQMQREAADASSHAQILA